MRVIGAAAIVCALGVLSLGSAGAQGIEVSSSTARNQFPDGVVFSLSANSGSEIEDVVFRYTIPPEGANVYGEPECSSGTSVRCTFTLKSGPKLFLVPGANIIYYWEIEDTGGDTLRTDQSTFVYEDDRFEWESLSEGNLTIWHYSGSENEARELLETGVEGLKRMERLLNVAVPFPVKVYLYDSADDMRAAAYAGQGSDGGVITLGEVFFSDTAVVAADIVPDDILRHEIAHIVVKAALEGPFGNAPAWLDEGTAIHAQSAPLADEEAALKVAVNADGVFRLRSMTSGSLARSNTNVSLFYGQSWSVVSYLVGSEGEEKFGELFATLKQGNTIDEALEAAYGFDVDDLDNAWRESVGLAPRGSAEGDRESTPVPKITPFTSGGQQGGETGDRGSSGSQAEAGNNDSGTSARTVALFLVAGIIAAILGTGGVFFIRRMRRPS